MLTVRTGTLDDTSWVSPVIDVWIKSAQPWVEFSDDRRSFEHQPVDIDDIVLCVEAFRAQGNFPDSGNEGRES